MGGKRSPLVDQGCPERRIRVPKSTWIYSCPRCMAPGLAAPPLQRALRKGHGSLLYLVFAALSVVAISGLLWHRRRAVEDPARTIDMFQRRIQALGTHHKTAKRRSWAATSPSTSDRRT